MWVRVEGLRNRLDVDDKNLHQDNDNFLTNKLMKTLIGMVRCTEIRRRGYTHTQFISTVQNEMSKCILPNKTFMAVD